MCHEIRRVQFICTCDAPAGARILSVETRHVFFGLVHVDHVKKWTWTCLDVAFLRIRLHTPEPVAVGLHVYLCMYIYIYIYILYVYIYIHMCIYT